MNSSQSTYGKRRGSDSSMASSKRARSQSRGRTPTGRSRSRSRSMASSRVSFGTSVLASTGRSKGSARDDDMAVVTKKRIVKGTKPKGRKVVKVSRHFKNKVTQALIGKQAIGTMQEIMTRKLAYNIPDSTQEVGYLLDEAVLTRGLFSPLRVSDAASCLFNRKVAIRAKSTTTDALEFNTVYTKINVISQSAQFRMSNQTQRTKYITIYEAVQKGNIATVSPLTAWDNGLTLDDKDLPDSDSLGPNLSLINKNFLYLKPTQNKQFNKEYSVSSRSVTLEPGQQYEFVIHGPKGIYDMAKYHVETANDITEKSKYTKYLFYTAHNDLVVSATGITGRFETQNPATTVGVVCEYVLNYKLEAPHTTGFKPGGTYSSTPQQLNLIKDAYIFKNYNATQAGIINRIDDSDPATREIGV